MRNSTKVNPAMLVLEKGELASFEIDGRRCQVSCISGRLWVTVTGQAVDYLLAAGDEVTVAARGRVVIEALTASMARVQRRRAERVKPRAPILAGGLPAIAFSQRPPA